MSQEACLWKLHNKTLLLLPGVSPLPMELKKTPCKQELCCTSCGDTAARKLAITPEATLKLQGGLWGGSPISQWEGTPGESSRPWLPGAPRRLTSLVAFSCSAGVRRGGAVEKGKEPRWEDCRSPGHLLISESVPTQEQTFQAHTQKTNLAINNENFGISNP